jgi:hypothetical protein
MTTNVDTTSARAPARSCDRDIDRLLHPGRFFERPADVLVDASLTHSERRAILSAWASDACAIDSAPALRHAPFASQPVTFDEIMDTLIALDRPASPHSMKVWNRRKPRRPWRQGMQGTSKRAAASMPVARID